MSSPSLATRLEAILYLKGRPISVGELAELSHASRQEVEQALLILTTRYAQQDSALEINETNRRYCLQLKEGMTDLVQDLLPVNLSTATLRTLATIALFSSSWRRGRPLMQMTTTISTTNMIT